MFAQCRTSRLQSCLSPAALARRVALKPSWRPSASGTARGKWYTQKRSAACTAGCSRLCWARVMRRRQRSSGCSAPAGGCAAPAAASASGHQAHCDPCLRCGTRTCKHAIHPCGHIQGTRLIHLSRIVDSTYYSPIASLMCLSFAPSSTALPNFASACCCRRGCSPCEPQRNTPEAQRTHCRCHRRHLGRMQ